MNGVHNALAKCPTPNRGPVDDIPCCEDYEHEEASDNPPFRRASPPSSTPPPIASQGCPGPEQLDPLKEKLGHPVLPGALPDLVPCPRAPPSPSPTQPQNMVPDV